MAPRLVLQVAHLAAPRIPLAVVVQSGVTIQKNCCCILYGRSIFFHAILFSQVRHSLLRGSLLLQLCIPRYTKATHICSLSLASLCFFRCISIGCFVLQAFTHHKLWHESYLKLLKQLLWLTIVFYCFVYLLVHLLPMSCFQDRAFLPGKSYNLLLSLTVFLLCYIIPLCSLVLRHHVIALFTQSCFSAMSMTCISAAAPFLTIAKSRIDYVCCVLKVGLPVLSLFAIPFVTM